MLAVSLTVIVMVASVDILNSTQFRKTLEARKFWRWPVKPNASFKVHNSMS